MIKQESKNAIRLIVGLLLLLAIIFGTNPPSRNAMLTYVVFLIVAFFIYSSNVYQKFIVGISKNNLIKSILSGAIFGVLFVVLTRILPGFSLGYPLLPNTIGDQLRFGIIVFIAPIAETLAFKGALLAYLREISPKRKQVAIIFMSVAFALAHLGAFLTSFYDYSTVTVGLSEFTSNLSVFLSAGIFAYISTFLLLRKGIQNLIFVIVFHMVINLLVFTNILSNVFTIAS